MRQIWNNTKGFNFQMNIVLSLFHYNDVTQIIQRLLKTSLVMMIKRISLKIIIIDVIK